MTGFEFAASVIGSVAWPLVIAALIFVLRAELKTAVKAIITRISDITEVSGAGVSVKLEKAIQDAADKAESLVEDVETPSPTLTRSDTTDENEPTDGGTNAPHTRHERIDETSADRTNKELVRAGLPAETEGERLERLRWLAVEEPKAAVLLAFSEMEGLMRRIYDQHHGTQHERYVSFNTMLRSLTQDEVLPNNVFEVMKNLSSIRNEAAHKPIQVSVKAAENYIEAIVNMLAVLTHIAEYKSE